MRSVLACWIGDTDLRAATRDDRNDPGPIARVLSERSFDELLLFSNRDPDVDHKLGRDGVTVRVDRFVEWLKSWTEARVTLRYIPLTRPTDHAEIFVAVRDTLRDYDSTEARFTFHLSPGTPAMAAVWLLLGKTSYADAELIESSAQEGVHTVTVPFDLSAEFLPDLLRRRGDALVNSFAAGPPLGAAFKDILHRSAVMGRVLARAAHAAAFNVPVLIEGETGTGKELLARAIHNASPRAKASFVAVNCGAIPEALFESLFFGYVRGAFTGATSDRHGHIEEARGGTLFLDEVGELPLALQVKLLRALQDRSITRLGSSHAIPVDVRIVAATNRQLLDEVAAGRFREDLFYRLAVATLRLPALRERAGDLNLLIDGLLVGVRAEIDPTGPEKKLSAGARNVLLRHDWPGNVRELRSTLQRAVVWSTANTIEKEDAQEALLGARGASGAEILGKPLGDDLQLPDLLAEVARHYLSRAMSEARGNKSRAAKLIGLKSYQTLTNWLERYAIDEAGKPVAQVARTRRSASGAKRGRSRGAT